MTLANRVLTNLKVMEDGSTKEKTPSKPPESKDKPKDSPPEKGANKVGDKVTVNGKPCEVTAVTENDYTVKYEDGSTECIKKVSPKKSDADNDRYKVDTKDNVDQVL